MAGPELPRKTFSSAKAWDAWLGRQRASSEGLWLQIAKKGSGIKSVSFPEALETAICYGWIDGQRKKLDDDYFIQKFTPRRAKSTWSKINRARAIALIESGRMKPPGLREVERAQADGRWDAAYDSPGTMAVPADLSRALARNKRARAFFETLDSRNRYAVLYRIHDAKRPDTRARRVTQFVTMLARGEKPYP